MICPLILHTGTAMLNVSKVEGPIGNFSPPEEQKRNESNVENETGSRNMQLQFPIHWSHEENPS